MTKKKPTVKCTECKKSHSAGADRITVGAQTRFTCRHCGALCSVDAPKKRPPADRNAAAPEKTR